MAVCTRGLSRNYARKAGTLRALDGLDLAVPRGTLFALLGPNGAGKSTTIAILTTLLSPTSGTASVAGWDVALHPREARRAMGVVFQEVSLDDRLTARENLQLFASIHGLPSREREPRIAARLTSVGLLSARDQRVRTFSGGMKRRLEIARALLHEPPVIVLDEPTVGLDPQTRRAVWEQLSSMAKTGERTVFVTTHYMDEAERCGIVAILDHGRLVAHGTPAELIEKAAGERLVVRCDDEEKALQLAAARGWRVRHEDGTLVLEGERPERMLAQLAEHSVGVREATFVRPKLEDAFVALTGRGLRDVHDDDAGGHAAMATNLRARGRR